MTPATAGVRLVTDSTAALPAELVRAHGIAVVPLQVVIAGQSRPEGRGVEPAGVAQALRERLPVSTSRPSPTAFAEAYATLAAQGADAVVSVHLSGRMSGTVDSAAQAARTSRVPVQVVDSRSLGMGTGYAVLAAARAAARGAVAEEVAAIARRRGERASVLFYVDTLEHLRRGGRIGAAQALIGATLAMKALLRLVDGQVRPLEKVRTSSRAIARLGDLSVECAQGQPVDVAVHHLASPERAAALAERLRQEISRLRMLEVSEVGAVVGAHVGPGMLAVVVSPVLEGG